jgi:hypothetical protein
MSAGHAIIGACVLMLLLVFVGILSINAIAMLISPRAWFELPEWLRLSGSMQLKKAKYLRGWGAFQVRFVGFIFLATFFVVLFEMMRHHG